MNKGYTAAVLHRLCRQTVKLPFEMLNSYASVFVIPLYSLYRQVCSHIKDKLFKLRNNRACNLKNLRIIASLIIGHHNIDVAGIPDKLSDHIKILGGEAVKAVYPYGPARYEASLRYPANYGVYIVLAVCISALNGFLIFSEYAAYVLEFFA